MRIKTIGWARLALKQQVEIFGGEQVSLDSLWRAADSPEGQDPRTWSELASPFLSGFASYLAKLDDGAGRSADPSRLLWIWEDDSKDPWRTGDVMTDEFIARAYAIYLDTQLKPETIPTANVGNRTSTSSRDGGSDGQFSKMILAADPESGS